MLIQSGVDGGRGGRARDHGHARPRSTRRPRSTSGSHAPSEQFLARINLLEARIEDPTKQQAAQSVTPDQVEAYVAANPRLDPEERQVSVLTTRSRAHAKQALKAISNGLTWASAAKRYGRVRNRTIVRTQPLDGFEQRVLNTKKAKTTRYGIIRLQDHEDHAHGAPRHLTSNAHRPGRSSRARPSRQAVDGVQGRACARSGALAPSARPPSRPTRTAATPQPASNRDRAPTRSTGPKTRTSADVRLAPLLALPGHPMVAVTNLSAGSDARGRSYEEQMFDAVATDGPPPPQRKGARVSERFQRMRVPALPTILFADANEDYRAMARDALLEGRNATDLRTVADGTELLAYLKRAGATEGAVTPAPSLIVLDAQLGLELIATIKADEADPGRRARRRRRSRDGQDGLRRRREHVHRQAGHVPRARAPDEGLHGVLAGDGRALTQMAAAQPLPDPLRVLAVSRGRRASCARPSAAEGRADRARHDARGGARQRSSTTPTTSCSSTARSTRPARTGCTSPRSWSRRRRTSP